MPRPRHPCRSQAEAWPRRARPRLLRRGKRGPASPCRLRKNSGVWVVVREGIGQYYECHNVVEIKTEQAFDAAQDGGSLGTRGEDKRGKGLFFLRVNPPFSRSASSGTLGVKVEAIYSSTGGRQTPKDYQVQGIYPKCLLGNKHVVACLGEGWRSACTRTRLSR